MNDIHYPSGVRPLTSDVSVRKVVKKKASAKVAPGNRGMAFEDAINETNAYYAEKGLCLISKRPTPIKVLSVDYAHGAHITSAVYEKQSTTDYNGVYQGHYIDFEAKSTRSKSSFPLANIPMQQIAHLQGVLSQKGIAFFLIQFALRDEVYLLPARYVVEFYLSRPRASIPYEDIKKRGILLEEGYRPRYDYLPALIEAFLK